MSTICKLDPNVRIARMRRGTASLEVANLARRHPRGTREHLALKALHVLLEDVRRRPWLTGWQKDEAFKRIMNRNR